MSSNWWMPHQQNFWKFFINMFCTYFENLKLLSLSKFDLWQKIRIVFLFQKSQFCTLHFFGKNKVICIELLFNIIQIDIFFYKITIFIMMVTKCDQGSIAYLLVIQNFMKFKILELIKIHPFYCYNFTKSVQLKFWLLEGQRP